MIINNITIKQCNSLCYRQLSSGTLATDADFGWRQYDPLVGRWFNNDPADQFSSISPYAYVRNNPLMYGDLDGAFSLQGLWNGVKDLVNCTIIPYLQNPDNLQTIALATGGFGGFAGLNAINQNNYGPITTPGRGVYGVARADATLQQSNNRIIASPCGTPDCMGENISRIQKEYTKRRPDIIKEITLESEIEQRDPYAMMQIRARRDAQKFVDMVDGAYFSKKLGAKAFKEGAKSFVKKEKKEIVEALDDVAEEVIEKSAESAVKGVVKVTVEQVGKNFNKISDNLLKKSGIDAHQLKRDFLGSKAKISQYDLYKDTKTSEILILQKKKVEKGIQLKQVNF